MAITQKRINQLETYVQLDVGDPGYIPATSVFLAADYSGWTESKKIVLDDLFSTLHTESGRLSSLASRSVAVSFGTGFTGTVIDSVKAYREAEVVAGKLVRSDVLFYNLSVTLSGFSLEVDSSEDLAGVIIDYNFIEA